jgi:DNA invertase Pin-like site-specific DNA recombinase
VKRVALYARVSTKDQSSEMQLDALNKYCAARDWPVTDTFVDHGVSGGKRNRPALDMLMQAARERKIDVIAVWKLDRFGRSLINLSQLLTELNALGVRFIAITDGIDTDKSNPTATLLLNLMCCFAQFERELIRERIQAGVTRAIAERAKTGDTWGCRIKPAVYAERRAKVDELRAQGLSVRQIHAATGISHGTVQRLLQALKAPPKP